MGDTPHNHFTLIQETTLNQFQSLILSSHNDQQLASLLQKKLNLKPSFIEGALRRAVASRKIDLLKHALEVNRLFPHDSTMRVNDELLLQQIHRTVTKQELEMLRCLLSYLTNPRGSTSKGELQNIAILATHLGFIDAVQLLCTQFPTCLEQTSHGHSLLIATACYSDDNSVSLLTYILEKGVNVNTQEPSGDTALHMAVRENNEVGVQLLLSHGACVHIPNVQKMRPLDLAQSDKIKQLLRAHPSPQAHEVSLYIAAKQQKRELVQQLINSGIPIESKWIKGRTALCAAAMNGDTELVDMLLCLGASIFPEGNTWPELPIAHALIHKHESIAYLLMERTELLYERKTAKEREHIQHQLVYLLHYCSQVGAVTVATLIMDSKYNLDLTQTFLNGVSPLHIACRYGQLRMVQVLLLYGMDPNLRSEFYLNTPFHYACFYGHVHIASYLLTFPEVDINCENKQHETPLYCVLRGQLTSQEKGPVREASVVLLLSKEAKLLKPGRKNCELAQFDLNYAMQRWDFIPFQTQKLIVVLRNEWKPYSLMNLSRFAIRGAILVPISEDLVDELGLPYRMQNYVLLKDWFPTN